MFINQEKDYLFYRVEFAINSVSEKKS